MADIPTFLHLVLRDLDIIFAEVTRTKKLGHFHKKNNNIFLDIGSPFCITLNVQEKNELNNDKINYTLENYVHNTMVVSSFTPLVTLCPGLVVA